MTLCQAISLSDDLDKFDYRQEHRDDYPAYDYPQEGYYQRLYKAGQARDGRVNLALVKIRDLTEHLFELYGLLSDRDHPCYHRREDTACRQGLRYRLSLFYAGLGLKDGGLDDFISGGL